MFLYSEHLVAPNLLLREVCVQSLPSVSPGGSLFYIMGYFDLLSGVYITTPSLVIVTASEAIT